MATGAPREQVYGRSSVDARAAGEQADGWADAEQSESDVNMSLGAAWE